MSEHERCRQLLIEADDLRFENPLEAMRLAEAARDRAAAIEKRDVGRARWLALQSDVWAVLGSNLRSVSEQAEAEGALNVALAFLNTPELCPRFDPLSYALLAQRAAYLRRDQGRYEEALELVDEAIEIYEEQGSSQAAAGAWLDRGLILGRAGRQQEALRHLSEALARLDPERSSRNFQAAIYNTALYLHELAEDCEEAHELALEWLDLACRSSRMLPRESFALLKIRALRALTVIRTGRPEDGVRELWQIQEGFEGLGAVYEQSLTLLHLAAVYLAQGHTEEVRRVAGRLFPLFRSLKTERRLDTGREASAALRLFYNAALSESVSLDLIDDVSQTLREAQARSSRRRG